MSSTYGKNIKISIFGQSHSSGIGVVIDGLPAGKKVDMKKLATFMARRAPGQGKHTTSRRETDEPEILAGLVDDITCGAPLAAVIRNHDTKSKDYGNIAKMPRPAHADFTAHVKYGGFEDVRGGGHFSGRLTAPLVVAGGICKQFLEEEGIYIKSEILEVGGEKIDIYGKIEEARVMGDSVGGIIECTATGLPVGLGEPMFHGVENKIASAIFAIPAVKGIEFGKGFESARLLGSDNNDEFYYEGKDIKTRTNNHGGILGGITTSMPVTFRVAIKPTPSIAKAQNTICYETGKDSILEIKGRHDPCIVPRALPCVEAAAALAIYDLYLEGK